MGRTIKNMIADGIEEFYEIGPGKYYRDG